MTRLHRSRTAIVARSKRAQAKRRSIAERKRSTLIEALQRWQHRAEAVLSDLQNAATLLEYNIEAELQKNGTRNPNDPTFPMSARTLMAHRDNLAATVAVLSEELTKR